MSDLWQFRSTRTTSPSATDECRMISLLAELPPIENKVWSAPKTRAAKRSASPTGPEWSFSEPSDPTETERSERSICSP